MYDARLVSCRGRRRVALRFTGNRALNCIAKISVEMVYGVKIALQQCTRLHAST